MRDFSAISPSAMALLLLKGVTDIPFAHEAASLVSAPETYAPDLHRKDLAYWTRVVHFEIRYKTVDALLKATNINNIIELSSGFSFRGLWNTMQRNVHYIDTDLPELMEQKRALLAAMPAHHAPRPGLLEMEPLNALDRDAFMKLLERFPSGPVVIVNEGLLMYLGIEEKRKLCAIIREALQQRGGCWITGDAYVRATMQRVSSGNDALDDLLRQQRIEDNMFSSFDEALAFFTENGFTRLEEAPMDFSQISSLKYLVANATPEELQTLRASAPKIQATWKLGLTA